MVETGAIVFTPIATVCVTRQFVTGSIPFTVKVPGVTTLMLFDEKDELALAQW